MTTTQEMSPNCYPGPTPNAATIADYALRQRIADILGKLVGASGSQCGERWDVAIEHLVGLCRSGGMVG